MPHLAGMGSSGRATRRGAAGAEQADVRVVLRSGVEGEALLPLRARPGQLSQVAQHTPQGEVGSLKIYGVLEVLGHREGVPTTSRTVCNSARTT